MYDRVLFPTDGSDPAEEAFAYALGVASAHDATVHVLNVVDTGRHGVTEDGDDVLAALERDGTATVDETARRASDRGVPVVTDVVRGDPSTSIVEYGDRSDIDLVVMATHGRRGLQRHLLGSITERVITTATVPVVAVNPGGDRPFSYPPGHILVPTDGSRGAARALTEGIAVANATGATLHLLCVVETRSLGSDARSVPNEEELTARASEIVADAAETAASASVDAVETEVDHGAPSRRIRSYIDDHDIDLAVLGTHGATDFSRYVMGGVSAKIVRTAPVPVTWVREPADDE
jgi:nucleotide-binding universal stress UspA family protein